MKFLLRNEVDPLRKFILLSVAYANQYSPLILGAEKNNAIFTFTLWL